MTADDFDEQPRRKLPNMNEFSPGVIPSLGDLLEMVRAREGDREAMREAIASLAPTIDATPGDQRLNRANNVLIGMSQCGLFALAENALTPLGREIANLPNDIARHRRFAQQLLVNCHGMELLSVADALRERDGAVTIQRLREELRARGFAVTTNEGNASKIRMWLERAGVVDADFVSNSEALHECVGIDTEGYTTWFSLTRAQRALALELRSLTGDAAAEWKEVSHLKKLCMARWGPRCLPEGQLRAQVLDPLVATGWIETRGTGGGRGGNAGQARATDKLVDVQLPLAVEDPFTNIPLELLRKMNRTYAQVYADLRSENTGTKGEALELLSLMLSRDLGLWPVRFRLRGSETGGGEVDLVAEGAHLQFSRWLFQCKNTTSVELADLAKEIGMAVLLKAHVVVMVTTGRFRDSLPKYAREIGLSTPMQVVLIARPELEGARDKGSDFLADFFHDRARACLTLKRTQLDRGDID